MEKGKESSIKESSDDLFADVFQTKADHSALLDIFENAKSKVNVQNENDDVGIMSGNDSSDSDDFVTVVPDRESVAAHKVGVYIFQFNQRLKIKGEKRQVT